MIDFAEIAKIEHLPLRLRDRLLSMPKEDVDFLLPMFDGDRRSGRTTKLSVFYACRLAERGYVKVLDHFFSEDSRKMNEYDRRLLTMIVKEMEVRGYYFGVPRTKKGIGVSFHIISNIMEIPHLVMTTNEDLDEEARRWRESIARCTAFNNFMERKNLRK